MKLKKDGVKKKRCLGRDKIIFEINSNRVLRLK